MVTYKPVKNLQGPENAEPNVQVQEIELKIDLENQQSPEDSMALQGQRVLHCSAVLNREDRMFLSPKKIPCGTTLEDLLKCKIKDPDFIFRGSFRSCVQSNKEIGAKSIENDDGKFEFPEPNVESSGKESPEVETSGQNPKIEKNGTGPEPMPESSLMILVKKLKSMVSSENDEKTRSSNDLS